MELHTKIRTQPDKTLLNKKHFRTPSSSSDDVVGARRAHNIDEQTYTIAQIGESLVGSKDEDEFGTDVSFSPTFNRLAIGAAQFATSGAGYANVYHLE